MAPSTALVACCALIVAGSAAAAEEHRQLQTGPPPKHFDPRRIKWDERVYYMLNTFSEGLPRSYNVPDSYWRSPEYLEHGLHPEPLDSQMAIEDRVCTKYGLNLYDAATWQIGLALRQEFEVQEVYLRQILFGSTTGRMDDIGGLKDIRGDTKDFHYGPKKVLGSALDKVTMPGNASNPMTADGSVKTIPGAYFYRMIAPCYKCDDPLIGKYAESFRYNKSEMKGKGPAWDATGVIVWNDWKPITGEQAWAVFIGPLQYLYIYYNGSIPMFSSYKTAPGEVQLGISILPAMMAMVSAPGSLYHCPGGSDIYPKDDTEAENVSNENNFSAYSGLRMLEFLLANNTIGSDPLLTKAKQDVDQLIQGLEKWFETGLFSDPIGANKTKIVYQGGHVSFDGTYDPVGIMAYSGFAVDCQTWGMSTLIPYMGMEWLESHLGPQGGYRLFQEVKSRGGHFINGTIAGVGFTQVINQTCVNVTTHGAPGPVSDEVNATCTEHNVWSAEWSFGAMTAAKTLATEYEKMGKPDLAADLRKDAKTMRDFVMVPTEDGGLNNVNFDGGMLYANTRFFIPWGWYSNAISSLCSTGWSIMEEEDFNPFVLGGNTSNVHTKPKVRVKAMATGKSEGYYEPYPGMEI